MGRGEEELVQNFAWAGGKGGGGRRGGGDKGRHAGRSAKGERHTMSRCEGVTTGTALLCSGVGGGDDGENDENGKRSGAQPLALCQALGTTTTAVGTCCSSSSNERM